MFMKNVYESLSRTTIGLLFCCCEEYVELCVGKGKTKRSSFAVETSVAAECCGKSVLYCVEMCCSELQSWMLAHLLRRVLFLFPRPLRMC